MQNDTPFIKDLWWKNPTTIVDDASNPSTYDYNICKKINQSSGYIEFQASQPNTDFYCTAYNQSNYPSQIYTSVRIIDGSYNEDFDLSVSINGVAVFDETFPDPFITPIGASGIILSGFYNPSQSDLENILKVRSRLLSSGFLHDIIKISVSSGIGQQIEEIELEYIGGSIENSYSSLTPTIIVRNPSGIDGNLLYDDNGVITTDASLVSGEITNSATESTYIYISGFNHDTNYSENYIDFKFDLEEYFGKNSNNITNQVDKIIFGLRYSLASGANTNNQEFSSVSLFSNKYDRAIAWGSGFYFKNTGGSFVSSETYINFLKDYSTDRYFDSSDLLDQFRVRLNAVPADCRISACELDIYTHDDSVFAMHIPGQVISSSGIKEINDSRLFNTGKNRFVEDFSYVRLMPIRNLMEDPAPFGGDSKAVNILEWGNYYEDSLDTYQYHNNEYMNYALLGPSGYYWNYMNSTNSYSLLVHLSTSGNYSYMQARNGANVINKQAPDGTEFLLNIIGDKYEFVSFDEFGTPASRTFDSTAHDIILITKQESGESDILTVYKSNTYGFFQEQFTDSRSLRGGFGKIYFGGSGIDDFGGYLHEYGYNENAALDVGRFDRARFSISEALVISGLSWDVQPTSGNLSDSFFLRGELDGTSDPLLYQYCTPAVFAYQNWVTNPSSFYINLDYKFESSNPSGLHISGVYTQKFVNDGEYRTIAYRFDKNLPSSGDQTINIYPFEVSNAYDEIPNRDISNTPSLTLYIKSYDNDGSRNKLTINSLDIRYDGWYLPQTGIDNNNQVITFYTNGYTIDNNDFDFFLQNTFVSSGVDFFIKGNGASTRALNFFIAAELIESSGVSMITTGQQVQDKSLNFTILQGLQPTNGGIPFYGSGTTPEVDVSTVNFYTSSTAESGIYAIQPLTLFSNFDSRNSINFFIGLSEDETEDSLNMFVAGNIGAKNKFNMFIPNQQGNTNYEFDMSMFSAYNQSGDLNMFIEGS